MGYWLFKIPVCDASPPVNIFFTVNHRVIHPILSGKVQNSFTAFSQVFTSFAQDIHELFHTKF